MNPTTETRIQSHYLVNHGWEYLESASYNDKLFDFWRPVGGGVDWSTPKAFTQDRSVRSWKLLQTRGYNIELACCGKDGEPTWVRHVRSPLVAGLRRHKKVSPATAHEWVATTAPFVHEGPTPTLPGLVIGAQIYVWCDYCDRFHLHGLPKGDTSTTTHRAAHCTQGGGYSRTGYRIQVERKYPTWWK